MAGVDLVTLKDLSGWTTLAMVTRYAHLLLGRPREGVERLVTAPPPSASRNQPEIAVFGRLVPPGRFDGHWDAEVRGIVYRRAA
jgi:hypothetical protein